MLFNFNSFLLPFTLPWNGGKYYNLLRIFISIVIFAMLGTPLLSSAQQAVCDGRFFLSQNNPTSLSLINTDVNPPIFTPIGGAAAIAYNSLGYSPTDGKLYAIPTSGGIPNHLIEVSQMDGSITDLGAVTGLPTTPAYNTGAFGIAGVFYAKPFGNTSVLYAINVDTKVATAIALSQSFTASDMAWVGGASGMMYSVADNGQLYSINVADGVVTAIGSADPLGGVMGAQFGGPNGLFGSANNGSGFYKIDLSTGKKTKLSDAPASGVNDGANCLQAPVQLPSDLTISKTDGLDKFLPGTDVVYTITVTNKGPFNATGATVNDPLPAGINSASWVCSAVGGGSCSSSGTGAILDSGVNLPVGASATYTLTLSIPENFQGVLVNVATVVPGLDNNDPNLTDNTATDTDTPVDEPVVHPPVSQSVPTLGQWALIALSAIVLAVFSGAGLGRVKNKQS